ncbi:Tyr recombinase domain-containing protein [Plasmodiophora brassicae]
MARQRDRRRPRTKRHRLPASQVEAINALAESGVLAAMNRYGLAILNEPLNLFERTGTGVENTKRAYAKHWRGLSTFFAVIGDYDSMLILDPRIANDAACPSMKLDSIRLYLDYKLLPPGTPMFGASGRALHTATGEQLIAEGGWNDPKICEQLGSAVFAIHVERGHTGDYLEPCSNCVALYADDRSTPGCERHQYCRRIWRSGNPRRHPDMGKALQRQARAHAAYVPQGDSALSPFEVARLRNYVFEYGGNDWRHLGMYAMFRIGIDLGLRSDELCSIRYDDFLPALTTVRDDGVVESLGIKVFGKDQKWRTRILFRNDAIPSLCPVRHLLGYIAAFSIKEEYIFRDDPADPSKPISYDAFNNWVSDTCSHLFERGGPWGTHVMRKSHYHDGRWRGASFGDLMKSAGHTSVPNALRYYQDADTVYHIALLNPQVKQFTTMMSPWRSTHIDNFSMAAAHAAGSRTTTTLFDLADRMSNDLDLYSEENVTLRVFGEKLLQNPSTNSVDQQIDELLSSVPADKAEQLRALISKKLLEVATSVQAPAPHNAVAAAVDGSVAGGAESGGQACHDTMNGQASAQRNGGSVPQANIPPEAPLPNPVAKRRGGTFDAPSRGLLKDCGSARERLDIVLRVADELKERQSKELTETCRQFQSTAVKPVIACFQRHHGSNPEAFLAQWPTFFPSRFAYKCCDASTDDCGTIKSNARSTGS